MKKLFERDIFWLFLICFVAILGIYPLFKKGYFYSFHDEAHFANLYEMIRAISSGQIPPRWAPDVNFNFGHPFFNFYYLFPFYIGATFNLVFGFSLISSMKLVFLLSVPLSGLAFYLLMRKFFGRIASFSAAVIYMFTPYRAVDLYVRGAVGEMWSFVFMPLVFASFASLVERGDFENFLFSSLFLAGLILTHNLTAIVFSPFIVLFCGILVYQKKQRFLSALKVLTGILAGFSLSAYYWLPALLEKKYMSSSIRFYPFDHFPFIKQLVIPSWGYGVSIWGPNDEMSFQIGVVNLMIVFLAIAVLFLRNKRLEKKKILLIFWLFCFGGSCFLMNIRSWFLWQIIPLGGYIEFPWRLLMLTTFFSSFLVGFLEFCFSRKKNQFVLLGIALLAILFTIGYFRPQNSLAVNDDYYLKRFFANVTSKGRSNTVSEEYFNYGEGHLPLTVWTEYRPSFLPHEKIEISAGKVNYQEITPVNYHANTDAPKEATLLFHTFYFPGWEALVDGEKIEIIIKKPLGEIAVPISSGKHTVNIRWTETPIRLFSDLLSLFTLIFLIIGVLAKLICRKRAVLWNFL